METIEMDLRGAKILLVDDTATNLDVLCELLGSQGFKLSVAPNGQIALGIADRIMPDLILLDVMMPGIDGFEVCRRLKQNEKTRKIPVIFITAEDMTESVVTGFEVGGVDYIKKPFQNEEVLVRVQTHLKIDRLTRELAHKNTELHLASERKSSFLANIAHELRTPITSMIGYVDNILDGIGGKPNERHEHYLKRVTENSTYLLSLVNDLLDLSKIAARKMEIETSPFSVRNLVASCCHTVEPLLQPGVKLIQNIADNADDVHTDEDKLRHVIGNLLSNAVKFTDEGEIRIEVKSQKSKVEGQNPAVSGSGEEPSTFDLRPSTDFLEITVSDTGIGIPAEALDTIFDEFQRVKGSDQKHKGTGLGLAITKQYTELLGGTVSVESEEGKGSTFTVRVPTSLKLDAQENAPLVTA